MAQRLGLDYLYLGYWIADCAKMKYKTNYKPLQLYRENSWQLAD
jgi:arginyl-tRNA--protein-N-Asp/Glu arginylyltransferase